MVSIKATGAPDFLNPIPTAAKRIAAAKARDFGRVARPLSMPRLASEFGPASFGRPRWETMSFKVPLGASAQALQRELLAHITKWLGVMDKKGFDFCGNQPLRIYPGVYPYVDPDTNIADPGYREMLVEAVFRSRSPKEITVEIPQHLLEPIVAGGGPAIPDDPQKEV